MWSILQVVDGAIYNLGTYATKEECDAAAKKGQTQNEYDVRDEWIYCINPDHTLYSYSNADLGVTK